MANNTSVTSNAMVDINTLTALYNNETDQDDPGQADMSTSPKQAVEEEVLSTNHSVLQQLSYDYSPDRYKYYLNKPHQDYIATTLKVQKLTANRVGKNIQIAESKQDDIANANNTIRRFDSMEDDTLLPRIFQPQRLMI